MFGIAVLHQEIAPIVAFSAETYGSSKRRKGRKTLRERDSGDGGQRGGILFLEAAVEGGEDNFL